MSERYKNQLLPYITRKQKLYLCNIRHIFLFPAIFDNLPPYSPRSTVPVQDAETGTVNSPTADTVPVTVPLCVPATAPYTAPSKGSNEVQ